MLSQIIYHTKSQCLPYQNCQCNAIWFDYAYRQRTCILNWLRLLLPCSINIQAEFLQVGVQIWYSTSQPSHTRSAIHLLAPGSQRTCQLGPARGRNKSHSQDYEAISRISIVTAVLGTAKTLKLVNYGLHFGNEQLHCLWIIKFEDVLLTKPSCPPIAAMYLRFCADKSFQLRGLRQPLASRLSQKERIRNFASDCVIWL